MELEMIRTADNVNYYSRHLAIFFGVASQKFGKVFLSNLQARSRFVPAKVLPDKHNSSRL